MLFLKYGHRQLVKRREAVSLGPEANSARSLDRSIIDVDEWPTIERDLDGISFNSYAEQLGLAGQNRNIDAGNLLPDTLYNMIQVDVIFQRIGTGNIIVVRVLDAKHQPSRLIDLSRYRRE